MKKKKPTVFGYVVVPSGDKEARASQMQALEEYTPDSILTDREYKTKTDRTSLIHILEMLKPEDVFVTTKLSNLGRSYAEILEVWKEIAEERGAYIVSLEPPAVDTRPGKKGASQTAIEFLSCLVENHEERSKKVVEGMATAKLKGVTPGPKRKIPAQFAYYKEEWQKKAISARAAAKQLGVCHRTFLEWARNS